VKIAVIAKRDKTLGDGLPELRRQLADAGYPDPQWLEIDKSKEATKQARRAIKHGADLIVVWGGDGTVQRCVEAVAGSGVRLAVPARRYRQPVRNESWNTEGHRRRTRGRARRE
jgi:diacylglycerol kinase family enzyme